MNTTLLSTVVAPAFISGRIEIRAIALSDLPAALATVTVNRCGHPLTIAVLKSIRPDLPEQEKGFWDGSGVGLAIRPKGGVRGSAVTGDTPVTIDGLEAVWVTWNPA